MMKSRQGVIDLDTNNRRIYLGGRLSPTAENAAREDTRPPIGDAPIICFHRLKPNIFAPHFLQKVRGVG